VQARSAGLRRLLHERPARHQRRRVLPHRIKAAASLYGVGIITDKDDSPHLQLDAIQGELYYAFAERDTHVPDHIAINLDKLLAKTDVKYEIKTFPGTDHGFAFPERPVYSTIAAEETWEKMFAMWERCLNPDFDDLF
jgi:carboxymethylenebutenolidase